ncbi:hypothetical protein Tco_1213878 [Tanacetum coccineum]
MVEYSQKLVHGTSRGRSSETSEISVYRDEQSGREIKRVNEKVYAAQVGCEQCKGPHSPKIAHKKKKGNITNPSSSIPADYVSADSIMSFLLAVQIAFLLSSSIPADYVSADSIMSFLLAVQVAFLLIMFLLVMFSFMLTEIESADC